MLPSPLSALLGVGLGSFLQLWRGNPPVVSLLFRSISALPTSNQLGRNGLLDEAPYHCPTCSCPVVLHVATEVEVL